MASPAVQTAVLTLAATQVPGIVFYHFAPLRRDVVYLFYLINIGILIALWHFSPYPELKWLVLSLGIPSAFLWMYLLHRKYTEHMVNSELGKLTLLCSPTFCSTDGTRGPLNGTEEYIFHPPNGQKLNYIPPNQFLMKNPTAFTFSFWMRVSYRDWSSVEFYGKKKPIFVKGSSVSSANPSAWLAPTENVAQFRIRSVSDQGVESLLLETEFPMDLWVQYTLVINDNVVELYKNGLLEKTKVSRGRILLPRTPLYLAMIPGSDDGEKLPGELYLFTYFNAASTASQVLKLYQQQVSMVGKLASSVKKLSKKKMAERGEKKCAPCAKEPDVESMVPKGAGKDKLFSSFSLDKIKKSNII